MDALQAAVHLPPPTILQRLDQLRQMGHHIETTPAYGFRLSGYVEKLTAELIEYGLGTCRIGRKVLVYESTDSTNDVAWHYAGEAGFDGLAVFAEHQRAGRGRLRRCWSAPACSSILCSILLQGATSDTGQKLTLMAGLAVAEAIEDISSTPMRIKWPNDVIASGRKLAGIMVESRKINGGTTCVVGIGINCSQTADDFEPELQTTAVSIRQLIDKDVDRLRLAQQLLIRMDQWLVSLDSDQDSGLHDKWLARCDNIGRRLTLVQDGCEYTGRVIDVSPDQGLLLQFDSGSVRFFDPATTSVQP